MKRLTRLTFTPANLNSKLLDRLHRNDDALVRVVFSSRDLGSQGVRSLAQALQYNTRLVALDLTSNAIGSAGACLVSLLLQHQSMSMVVRGGMGGRGGIRTLMLGGNDIRDDGAEAIADAIGRDVALESLWMDDNHIGASGLALLAEALTRNTNLSRLHLRHNWFQSPQPLIACTFDKRSLDSVAQSNHTLKHVFLDCGYSYECEELETILKINRMGSVKARRTKIALFLGEDMSQLLGSGMDIKLLPRVMGILADHGNISTMYGVMHNFPQVLALLRSDNDYGSLYHDCPMDFEYIS